jgi:hypothetical protein
LTDKVDSHMWGLSLSHWKFIASSGIHQKIRLTRYLTTAELLPSQVVLAALIVVERHWVNIETVYLFI